MKYNTMKLTVGFFILALFTAVASSLFFLLEEKGVFEARNTYHFQTTSAEYFHVGMPLKLSGFTIGAIDNIALADDGSVHMDFSIKKRNQKWLTQGSVLLIIKPLLGSPHIELYTSLDSPLLEKGASLEIMESDSINDLIASLQPVVRKALNILDSVNTITSKLASEDSQIQQILNNVNTLTTKLANDNSAKNLNMSLQNIKQITYDMKQITTSLNKTIIHPASSSLQEMEKIMKDIKQKLNTLDGVVQTVGTYDKDLVALKEQISVGIQKSNQIIDKVDAIMSDDTDLAIELP